MKGSRSISALQFKIQKGIFICNNVTQLLLGIDCVYTSIPFYKFHSFTS